MMQTEIVLEERYLRIKRCRGGLMMYIKNDDYVGRSFDTYGEFSEGEAALFRQILRPGMVVIDVGANIGAHTVTMAKAVGPKGRVHAFEPQRILYQILCGNLALNTLGNVTAHMAALGSNAGSVEVPKLDYSMQSNFGAVTLAPDADRAPITETVLLETLDHFNLPSCHFIKIDVEGMEKMVIEGALATLERCKPMLFVENDRWDNSAALVETLRNAGYKPHWHVSALFNPQNHFAVVENIFPSIVSFNLLCIPNGLNVSMKDFVEVTEENCSTPP